MSTSLNSGCWMRNLFGSVYNYGYCRSVVEMRNRQTIEPIYIEVESDGQRHIVVVSALPTRPESEV